MTKLSDQQVLQKCVEKAVKNGWNPTGLEVVRVEGLSVWTKPDPKEYEAVAWDKDDGTPRNAKGDPVGVPPKQVAEVRSLEDTIFDHDFAKALFGEENGSPCMRSDHQCEGWHPEDRPKKEGYYPRWLFHIQGLATSEDRIDYLRRWLNE